MPRDAERLLRMEGVAVGYGRPLLSGLKVEVLRGDFLGVFGPNGGGKTTFVKTLLGALKPLAGQVWRRPDLRVGYVPQQVVLRDGLPLSVRQVVALGGLGLEGLEPPEEALRRMGIASLAGRPFSSLSGGQRQRVLVARALHRQPDLLVLDEPANNVDLLTRHALMRFLNEANASGTAVLLITHQLEEIGPEVQKVLWLDAGQNLSLYGGREEVLSHPRLQETYGDALARGRAAPEGGRAGAGNGAGGNDG